MGILVEIYRLGGLQREGIDDLHRTAAPVGDIGFVLAEDSHSRGRRCSCYGQCAHPSVGLIDLL